MNSIRKFGFIILMAIIISGLFTAPVVFAHNNNNECSHDHSGEYHNHESDNQESDHHSEDYDSSHEDDCEDDDCNHDSHHSDDNHEANHHHEDDDCDGDDSQNEVKKCVLTLTKTDNTDPVILPVDTITYRLTLKNIGTANCTGGGVKLRDEYDENLTYVSHFVSPTNYSSFAAPIIDATNRFIELNFATMYPGDMREVDIVFKVKTSLCGYTAINKAKYFSDQTDWSQLVSESTTVSCAPAQINNPPVITLIGQNSTTTFQNSVFIDPGATANDQEDGNITANIITGGSVNTSVLGSYTLTYNVSDSQNVPAVQIIRTIQVVPVPLTPTQCSDNADNDGDNKIDTQDTGCHTDGDPNNPTTYDPNDNNENTAPVITILGANPFLGTEGDLYVDAGATAQDEEDGNITVNIVIGGNIATSTTLAQGLFTITYAVTDSGGLSDAENRTVNVQPKNNPPPPPSCTSNCNPPPSCTSNCNPPPPSCTSNCNPPPSCTSNCNPPPSCTSNCNPPPPSCTSNCGGGASIPNLIITNEKVVKSGTTTATVTWTTNISATSRVTYGENSYTQILSAPNYGYASTTNEDATLTASHTMTINGVDFAKPFYFRPISKAIGGSEILGIELSLLPEVVPPHPIVLGVAISCEEYILEYLRIGQNNNPVEVRKLQVFLRDFEGFAGLRVTGIFDQETFDAVSAFQRKYRIDVLDPWSLPDATGYVYYTTRKKINEIYCQREFPLNAAQMAEISQFKSLIESLSQRGIPSSQTVPVLQGQVDLKETPALNSTTTIVSAPSQTIDTTALLGVLPVTGKPTDAEMQLYSQSANLSDAVFSENKPNSSFANFSEEIAAESQQANLQGVLPEHIFNKIEEKNTTETAKTFAGFVFSYLNFYNWLFLASLIILFLCVWILAVRYHKISQVYTDETDKNILSDNSVITPLFNVVAESEDKKEKEEQKSTETAGYMD